MYLNKKNGFTLVELLAVIAIIGILASVVLASQSSQRKRASDGVIMSQLKSARLQADIYKEFGGGSYEDVCSDPEFIVLYEDAKKASGAVSGSACNDSPSAWAAYVPLKNPPLPATGWCVDSTGAERAVSQALVQGGAKVCPSGTTTSPSPSGSGTPSPSPSGTSTPTPSS